MHLIIHMAFVVMFTLISNLAKSQYYTPPMPPMYHTYGQRIFFSQPNYYRYSPTTNVEIASRKHDFVIVFTDSTQQIRRAKLDEYKNEFFLAINLRDEVRSIKPRQTLLLSMTNERTDKVYVGFPADSCWLFKIVSGKINLYSLLAEEDEEFIVAMQEGDEGPILPITRQNVEAVINQEHVARKLVQKRRLVAALKKYNQN